MKIGIIFDNQTRSETTGFYCRRALSQLAEVEHLLPEELNNIPKGLFDLFLLIDDGLDYEIPDQLRPRAAWAIDTHMNMQRSIQRFGNADWIFAAQKNGAEQMSQALGRPVQWLPLACDPKLHHPVVGIPVQFDIGFVGHPVGHRRCQLLDVLKEQFPSCWVGQAFHQEMALQYSKLHVAFNCSIAGDVNMRLFEALACGCALVTDDIDDNGLDELFDTSRHLLCYRDESELIAVTRELVEDGERRSRLAELGRQHVLEHHTYGRRMQVLLEHVVNKMANTPPAIPYTKSQEYFEFDRPDVASLVPSSATRIIDIGCGGGRLGATIKQRQTCFVTGVEQSRFAAQRAANRIDQVVECSIDDLSIDSFPENSADCIIFADVLEHLRRPIDILKKCSKWLSDEGNIVVSVPNNRHHSVVRGLLDGNWTYERAGLLDEDHVRCFTFNELEKLLFRAGFSTAELLKVPGGGYREWESAGRPLELDLGRARVTCRSEAEAEEFFVYQHVVRATPRKRPTFGLTSIIIPTFNQLSYTQQCVDSIVSRTDEPYELIFVDNASTDGTPDYLNSVDGARVICNESNRGFAPAVNQGIEAADGDQILLLNNDTIVTTGWLEGLLEALHDRPDTGLVGPVSNQVSGPQQIPVEYEDLASLDGFAWRRREQREMTQADRLVGFCLLLRREVVDTIGLLDERFEIGCFEDDDLCRRALEAGYKAFIASHVFVHHFGSVTFQASGFDFRAIMKENQKRYDHKWADRELQLPVIQPVTEKASRKTGTANGVANLGEIPEIDAGHRVLESDAMPSTPEAPEDMHNSFSDQLVRDRYRVVEVPNNGQLLQRKQPHISLCMIVRDNEDTMHACLDSVYPWVDEIIIVDTGSVDNTQSICKEFGARMFDFPWCDDFSAARNASIEQARGQWVFWMDSDDTIPQEQGKKLRELALGEHRDDVFGYVAQVQCPSGQAGELTVVDHVKLFRNLPELRFEHCIHEQILPAIRRAGGTVEFTDIHVVHSGSRQTPEVRTSKLQRDFRILEKDLVERPDHPFVLFNLGMTCEDAGEFRAAEDYLRRCIEVSGVQESHLRKAWALRVNCLRSLERISDAIEMASGALKLFPGDKELLFRRAMLHQDAKQYNNAVSDYQQVLDEPTGRVFQSLDPSICGYKAHHNLAITLKELGRIEEAIPHWTNASQQCPHFRPAWLSLMRCWLELKNFDEANQILKSIPKTPNDSTWAIAAALLDEAKGEVAAAHRRLETAWDCSGDYECLEEAGRILMHSGQAKCAVGVLQRLEAAQPSNAAILHNLGAALHASGQEGEAIAFLHDSLRLRPDGSHTRQLLADAYHRSGNEQMASNILSAEASDLPRNADHST